MRFFRWLSEIAGRILGRHAQVAWDPPRQLQDLLVPEDDLVPYHDVDRILADPRGWSFGKKSVLFDITLEDGRRVRTRVTATGTCREYDIDFEPVGTLIRFRSEMT